MTETIDTKINTYLRRYVIGSDNIRARDEAVLFTSLNYNGRIFGHYQGHKETPPYVVVAYDKRVN